jgi:acetylornithine/succinyldiaminopimelate/putrescine aminotransferase
VSGAAEERIPLAKPVVGERERELVDEVLRSGQLSLGPMVERFERAWAERAGTDHAVAVSSGTAGLHLCLHALGLGPGDEVVTSSFSFVASANAILFTGATPVFAEVDPLTFNMDPAAVEAAITPRTVAVMLEPIQGEAGVFEATVPFMRGLRALTRERGLLFILDEIQTGIGRTGRLFGFEHAGTTPDIMTLAKGLGGGVPLAALVAHRDVSCFEYGDQGGTFCGNPLMAAVGCTVIEAVTQPGFLARVTEAGEYLTNRLKVLSHRHGCGEVRGKGLLLALDLRRDVAVEVSEAAMARGLLVNAPRADSLRFMPALTVSDDEIDRMIEILDSVLG